MLDYLYSTDLPSNAHRGEKKVHKKVRDRPCDPNHYSKQSDGTWHKDYCGPDQNAMEIRKALDELEKSNRSVLMGALKGRLDADADEERIKILTED